MKSVNLCWNMKASQQMRCIFSYLCLIIPSMLGTSRPTYSDIPTSLSKMRNMYPSEVGGGMPRRTWLGGSRFWTSPDFSLTRSMASLLPSTVNTESSTLVRLGERSSSVSSCSRARVEDDIEIVTKPVLLVTIASNLTQLDSNCSHKDYYASSATPNL